MQTSMGRLLDDCDTNHTQDIFDDIGTLLLQLQSRESVDPGVIHNLSVLVQIQSDLDDWLNRHTLRCIVQAISDDHTDGKAATQLDDVTKQAWRRFCRTTRNGNLGTHLTIKLLMLAVTTVVGKKLKVF